MVQTITTGAWPSFDHPAKRSTDQTAVHCEGESPGFSTAVFMNAATLVLRS